MRRTRHLIRTILPALSLFAYATVVEAQVTVINMIPNAQSGETNQDSEPNLSVNPANPQQIAGTAFTSDPFGGANAPIFVSTNGGTTWSLNSILQSNNGSTGDVTVRFGGTTNALYAGTLRGGFNFRLNIQRSPNFTQPNLMTLLVDRTGAGVDQPYVQATTVLAGADLGKDRVYVGDNDFNGAAGRTATMDRSLDGIAAAPPPPANFATQRIEARATSGQDGPPIRPVYHGDGTVYGIFYGWRAFNGSIATTDVVMVRDDNWAAGGAPWTALVDPGDNVAGRRVVTGIQVPFDSNSQANFGQERFVGSNLSIAVDPRTSSRVYIAWADYPGGNPPYTLHVRRSDNRGATWTGDLITIPNATNPALAVNIDGKVGFLYQQVTGAVGAQIWETHLRRSTDLGVTWNDLLLARPPANAPAHTFLPYIGDYVHLLALGEDFYGIFSANNTPDLANFPQGVTYQRNANFATHTLLATDNVTPVPISIDPFFFHVFEGPQPYQRSVNSASYVGSSLAPESIASAFGANLATTTQSAPPGPPPTSLGGTTVTVKDAAGTSRLAPLFFVSPGQVNYEIPPGTVTGTASVTVASGSGASSRGPSQIAAVAPGLYSANGAGFGVAAANLVRVHSDGTQVTEPVAQFDPGSGTWVPVPIQFAPGDTLYLVLYGTGIRGNTGLAAVSLAVGFTNPAVFYAGPQGSFVGEDQVNAGPLSTALAGAGQVNVVLTVNGQVSNTVTVTFQ
jgi:uncharacterized protein (TIGR03437 family)